MATAEDDGRLTCTWDITQILLGTNVCDNVVDSLTKKVQRLPDGVHEILRVAAFLGFQFDLVLLEYIVTSSSTIHQKMFFKHIDTSLKEGLIERSGGSTYKWSHDRIQECVYESVPDQVEREKSHLQIGRCLKAAMELQPNPEQQQLYLFLAVDQYNRGISQLTDEKERLELAGFNLCVGKSAIEKSSFQRSAEYIEQGLRLLDPQTMWEDQYSLALALSTAEAQVNQGLGNFAECDLSIAKVIRHAKSNVDKITVKYAHLESLGLQFHHTDLFTYGRKYLADNDEVLPEKPSMWHVLQEMVIIKAKLAMSVTEESLLNAKQMDEKQSANIKILMLLCTFAIYTNQSEAVPFYMQRMFRCTVNYGLSPLAAASCASYAVVCGQMGNTEEAFKYRRIALKLMERPDQKESIPFCYCFLGVFITHRIAPLNESVFLEAYSSGIQQGQVFFAYTGATQYMEWIVFSGLPLKAHENVCRVLLQEMIDFKQTPNQDIVVPTLQMMSNLMYDRENPTYIADLESSQNQDNYATYTVMTSRLAMCVFYGDASIAEHLLGEFKPASHLETHYNHKNIQLWLALLLIKILRNIPARKVMIQLTYSQKLQSIRKWMERQVSAEIELVRPMLELVQAEILSLKAVGDGVEKVLRLYDTAVASAEKQKLWHVAALANEKAGEYVALKQSSEELAKAYLMKAVECYEEWNAFGKVAHLRRTHAFLSG